MKTGKIIIVLVILASLSGCSSDNVRFEGENIILNGVRYVETPGWGLDESKSFTEVDNVKLYRIIGDDDLNYFYAHSYLDGYLYMKEGYEPTQNELTAVIKIMGNHEYKEDSVLDYFSNINTKETAVSGNAIEIFANMKDRTVMLQYDNQPVCHSGCHIIYDEKEDNYIIYNNALEFYYCVSDEYKDIVKMVFEGAEVGGNE